MARVTADDWARAALKALGEGGESAVRVEVLARALGVTKGSYYHHFRNRRAVLDRAVLLWEELATEAVIAQVDAASGLPRERLEQLGQQVFASSGQDGIESALREWAAADEAVAEVLERVDERRLSYVEGLLSQAGVRQARSRSELLYRTLIGEYTWRRSGGPALSAEAIDLLVDLLLAEPQPGAKMKG